MNVDNQTILHVKAGQLPPEELLKLILGTKPTAFGFSVQEAEGAPMQVAHEDAENLDMDNLNSFLTDTQALNRSIYFGKLKAGYNPEDIQPFVIRDPDENVFMSIFLEGTINGHDVEGRTEQAAFINKIIIPKVIDYCETFDGDIEKVMAKLNGDVFNNDFLAHIGHRAVLNILPHVGEPVFLGPNTIGGEFDWGRVSQLHKFGEQAVQEPEPVVVKKTGWFSGKKATVSAEEPKKVVPPAAVPSKVQDAATKEEAPKAAEIAAAGGIPVVVRPPSWLRSNEDVREFYIIVSGKVHPGWKKKLPTTVTQNHEVMKCNNYDEYTTWKLTNLKATIEKKAETAPMVNNTAKPQTKQERIAAQAEKTAPVQGPVDQTPLPIIEAKDLEKVLDFVAKHLDGNSKEIIPPQEMQATEKKLPKFSEAVGVKLEEMLNWPVGGLFQLAATDPRAMVLFALEWRAYARQYLQAELKAKAKDGVKTTVETEKAKTTTTVDGNLKKVESVAKSDAPKKNAWGYGKKAA